MGHHCNSKVRPGERKTIAAVAQDVDVVQYDATIPDDDDSGQSIQISARCKDEP